MKSRSNPRSQGEFQEEAGCRNHSASTPVTEGDLSYQATGWVLEFSESKLGPRLVLLALSHRLNIETGVCFPSLDTLAKECRMTKQGVIQAIKKLEGLKELKVTRIEKPTFGNVNTYSMPPFSDWWAQAKLLGKKQGKGKRCLPSEEPERVNAITERVNPIKKEGKYGLPEQEVERKLEKKEEEPPPLPLQSEEKDWKKIEDDNERLRQAKEDRKARKANGGRKPFVKREYATAERSTNVSRQAIERPRFKSAAERRREHNEEVWRQIFGPS